MLTKTDLSKIQKVVKKELKSEIDPLKKDVKTLRNDVAQIRKDVKTIVNFFDREYLELRKRIERIEEHLDLPQLT